MAQTDKNWMSKQRAPSQQEFQGLTDDGLINAANKFKTFLRKPPPKQSALQYVENGIWESSKDFDKTINAIGKNRKYLLEIFKHLTQNGQIPLTEDIIKQEMDKMLRSQGIVVRDEQWPQLISWSKKNGRIDYKFLLEVYKDRLNGMDTLERGMTSEYLLDQLAILQYQLNKNLKKSPYQLFKKKVFPRIEKVMSSNKIRVLKKSQTYNSSKCLFVPKNKERPQYYITPPSKYKKPLTNIEELNIDSNCSTDSSQRLENLSPMYYCPKGKEPCGELQVVLNGDLIQVISQTKSRKKSRKFSDQETYAMSNFIAGPKCQEIPCPQFL